MPQDIQLKSVRSSSLNAHHTVQINVYPMRKRRDKSGIETRKSETQGSHCQCRYHSFATTEYRSVTELTLDERMTERSTSAPKKEVNAIRRGCTDCENWLWLGQGLADAECALTDGTNAPLCAPLSLVLTSAALPAAAAAAAMIPTTTTTTTTLPLQPQPGLGLSQWSRNSRRRLNTARKLCKLVGWGLGRA